MKRENYRIITLVQHVLRLLGERERKQFIEAVAEKKYGATKT